MTVLNCPIVLRLGALGCISAALLFSGCGGTGQDESAATSTTYTLQGLAVDGYIARATVFIDYDNNQTRDPWEPSAFTDDDGYFSYNPITQTDYCAANAPPEQKLFCLRFNRSLRDTVVRIDGGYDVMTGEPFYGQLSRRVSVHSGDPGSSLIISPITSILTDIRSETQRNAIMTALGIHADDLDQDYLYHNGDVASHLLSLALRLHKTVSLVSQDIQRQYGEVGSQTGSMNDLSANVYKHLARQLAAGNVTLDEITSSQTLLEQVLAQTELDALAFYDKWEIPLPLSTTAMSLSSTVDRVSGLSQFIQIALNEADTSGDSAAIRGAVKLIEAMTIKAGDNTAAGNSFRSSLNYLTNPQNRALLHELISSLAEADSDLVSLARIDVATGILDSPDAVRAATRLPLAINPLQNLSGQQLRVSDMDLGRAPNQLRDSEVELYFHGNSGDTGGEFKACIKYIKDANISGRLGDGNTRGELVKGYWSLLGASQNNGTSYSLLLTIEFLGAKCQAILKPAVAAHFNSQEYMGVRFDYANELRTWYSARGAEPIRSLPQSHTECAARLPSRIGI